MAYDNSRRRAAAGLVRRRILAAADERFLAVGFGAASIREIADLASVSPESVYKQFGSKAGLLKGVYDTALAGDDTAIAMVDRPEAAAVREATTPATSVAAYARMAGLLGSRIAPILTVMITAQGGDPAVGELASTVENERLAGATGVAEYWAARHWLRADVDVRRAADVIWTVNSPEVRSLLIRRGWTEDAYEAWIVEVLLGSVMAADVE